MALLYHVDWQILPVDDASRRADVMYRVTAGAGVPLSGISMPCTQPPGAAAQLQGIVSSSAQTTDQICC